MRSLLAGVLFGARLAVAQMTNPQRVLGFLDVADASDPSQLVVPGAAVGLENRRAARVGGA